MAGRPKSIALRISIIFGCVPYQQEEQEQDEEQKKKKKNGMIMPYKCDLFIFDAKLTKHTYTTVIWPL